MRRRSIARSAAAMWILALLVGCSGATVQSANGRGLGDTPAAAAPAPDPADVHFISNMIQHHSQALVMAELALAHAQNPQIRTLAERIHVSQTDEIRLMRQWLAEGGVGADHDEPGRPTPDHSSDHVSAMGMLTPDQLARLTAARGSEFDRLFLMSMIQHHEGALSMVEALFATHGGGVDDFIYKIASDTFADQGSEIDRMQRMLDAMEGAR